MLIGLAVFFGLMAFLATFFWGGAMCQAGAETQEYERSTFITEAGRQAAFENLQTGRKVWQITAVIALIFWVSFVIVMVKL